jgi:hypothetical protein
MERIDEKEDGGPGSRPVEAGSRTAVLRKTGRARYPEKPCPESQGILLVLSRVLLDVELHRPLETPETECFEKASWEQGWFCSSRVSPPRG